MKYIFLLGHRQQHGKNVVAEILIDLLQKHNLSYSTTYFAKKLKKIVADKYNLNFLEMENNEYKSSKPSHLNGLTIRDVLIKEGCHARSIWEDTWSFAAYNELIHTNCDIGIISDFRYPNEFNSYNKIFNDVKNVPIVKKIHVFRPAVPLKYDGADDQLPDTNDYWDYIITNKNITNWKEDLANQVETMLLHWKIICN